MFFVVLFFSPLYFLLRRKWGGFVVSAFLYGMAILCLASIFFFWLALVPWLLAVVHAFWYFHREMGREMMEEHASLIAAKMAEQTNLASATNRSEISAVAPSIPSIATTAARPDAILANSVGARPRSCENCGAQVNASSSFCEECGVKVASLTGPVLCPGCGNEVMSSKKFCSRCGLHLIREETQTPGSKGILAEGREFLVSGNLRQSLNRYRLARRQSRPQTWPGPPPFT